MLTIEGKDTWNKFLDFIQERCSPIEYQNWFLPIKWISFSESTHTLEVPNIFVQEYLLNNYKEDLLLFFPSENSEDPNLQFIVAELEASTSNTPSSKPKEEKELFFLNERYTFTSFIEGPSNQFIKSAALGVAKHPGKSYNPLFIHGGVGLGKTHLLHGIAHYLKQNHKKLRLHSITTEGFINDLVDHLKNKKIDKMKKFYRNLDILLVDDIQFLQNRMNFEEEFCNTFESLINQNKQIVITSDKPPGQLKLSERMIARMEWGLVAHIAMPDLETRVAILQYKAELKGIHLNDSVAFYIAENIVSNVRQLEGAINRLGAYCKLLAQDVTLDIAKQTLGEMFSTPKEAKITVDNILKSVSAMYDVKVSDLRGSSRTKEVAFPRQIAMYLAKELIKDPIIKLASAFGGKTHSTLLHSWKKISKQLEKDEALREQIQMTKQNIHS